VWDHKRFDFFDEMKIWCGTTAADDILGSATRNTLMLSEAFWNEIEAHPIPVDIGVVRELTNTPGCLDSYMWLAWRCYTAKRTEAIPLFGNYGLATQLGVPEYSRDRNFHKAPASLDSNCCKLLDRDAPPKSLRMGFHWSLVQQEPSQQRVQGSQEPEITAAAGA
jgi:hypothetical protein